MFNEYILYTFIQTKKRKGHLIKNQRGLLLLLLTTEQNHLSRRRRELRARLFWNRILKWFTCLLGCEQHLKGRFRRARALFVYTEKILHLEFANFHRRMIFFFLFFWLNDLSLFFLHTLLSADDEPNWILHESVLFFIVSIFSKRLMELSIFFRMKQASFF